MNLFELSAKLRLDKGEYDKGLKEAEGATEKTMGKILGHMRTDRLMQIGAVALKGVRALVEGIANVAKSAVGSYRQYEQLAGGVKKIFGDAAPIVMAYAEKAYKTAGLSANQYMEQVTSFSASLISSVGGNTIRAADVADMAIRDMADNANTFGTSIDSIQNAYQGFAKQNYTMLDNLKLGYGGTKTEMERLLKDAEEIQRKNGKIVSYSINNLADVYEAIHVVQQEMGVTGTTAAEAGSTIEGSAGAMKAAWDNMLLSFVSGKDIKRTVTAFVESVNAAIGNLIPAVESFFDGFSDAMDIIAPQLADKIPAFIEGTLPKMLKGVIKIITAIGRQLPTLAKSLVKTGANAIIDIINGVFDTNLPHITEIRWPTWPEVQAAAEKAWALIQEGARSLAGLVFGRKADGSVDWPDWSTVVKTAESVWQGILTGALNIANFAGKLVFGEKKDGSVAWPTWDDVVIAARLAFVRIRNKAQQIADLVGGIVFGRKKDGSVAWPEWPDVVKAAKATWEDICAGALNIAEIAGDFIFGRKEDGSVAWPTWADVQKFATEKFDEIKEGAAGLGEIVMGTVRQIHWPTWREVGIWAGLAYASIKRGLTNLVNTLGELAFGTKEDKTIDWPDWSDVGQAAEIAWKDIQQGIEGLFVNLGGFFSAFGEAADITALQDFGQWLTNNSDTIRSMLESVGAAIVTYWTVTKVEGIIKFIQSLTTLSTGNKVALILSAIAAAIVLIMENWDKIEPVIGEIGEWLDDNLLKPISDFIEMLQDVIKEIGSFFGIDTSNWFAKKSAPGQSNGETSEMLANGYVQTYRGLVPLEPTQAQSLAAMRRTMKEQPNAMFIDTEDPTKTINAAEAFYKEFERILKGMGYSDDEIKEKYRTASKGSDEAFANLLNELANPDQWTWVKNTEEAATNVTGFSEAAGAATSSLGNLTTVLNSLNELNSEDGSHASGLNFVPYDDYLANLHRGEAVLTRNEADRYRNGGGNSADIGAIVAGAIQEAMSGLVVALNGGSVGRIMGDAVTDRVNRNIGGISRRNAYGLGGG